MSRFVDSCSVQGPFRNETTDLIVIDHDIGLYAVVDAQVDLDVDVDVMHGHIDRLLRGTFRAHRGDFGRDDVVQRMDEFRMAFEAIVEGSDSGCMLTALVWPPFQTRAWLAQCGNTLGFHVDLHGAVGLARPHTMRHETQIVVRHELRNVITRVLGYHPGVAADVVEFAPGRASIVLVTAGVHEELEDAPVPLSVLVSATLRSSNPAKDLCSEALRRGSRNNASAVVVRAA